MGATALTACGWTTSVEHGLTMTAAVPILPYAPNRAQLAKPPPRRHHLIPQSELETVTQRVKGGVRFGQYSITQYYTLISY